LRRFIFPIEKNLVDREIVYWGTLHGAMEMIEGGTTCPCSCTSPR
jgi:cytosine/adenosine deaminase-related metal-dependent hydrolase